MDGRTAVDEVGVDVATAGRVAELYVETLHKRTVPPTPGIRGGDERRPSYSRHPVDEVRAGSGGAD